MNIRNEEENLARNIANTGNFNNIYSKLKEKGLLLYQVKRTETEYQDFLSKMEFLTAQDMELFTILELYDKELALHSINTYLLAKEKVEKTLAHDVVLVDLFTKENVSPEQFFRACLFHDIGKIEIPNFILNNSTNEEKMNLILKDLVINRKDTATIAKLSEISGETIKSIGYADIENVLKKHNLRSVHVVPIKFILSQEELEIAKKRNIDTSLTLMEIIQTHENFSAKILIDLGLKTEGVLAGSHHNYHGNGSSYNITIEKLNLNVDIAELIRLADITDALTTSRSYNNTEVPKLEILKIIMKEVNAGKINPKLAYLWINDEVKTLETKSNQAFTSEEIENLTFIKERLEKIHQTIDNN